MAGSSPQPDAARATIRAVLGVARGQIEAIGQFGDTRQAFIISLLPLAVIPVLNGLITQAQPSMARAMLDLLTSVCALLVPPVLTHTLATLWGREAAWLRFATAFNWCQLALLMVAMVALMIVGSMTGANAAVVIVAFLGIYALWLHWFLARHGLGVSAGRAAALVVAVHAATTLVVMVPRVLAAMMRTPGVTPT